MIELIVNNSSCQINNVPDHFDIILTNTLRYSNQSVSFGYFKNVRAVNRLKDLLADSRMGMDRDSVMKTLRRLSFMNQGLEKKLFTVLYKNGTFPTGLLPRVLKLLKDYKLQFVIKDQRVEPKLNSEKYVLKESFPPLRYYQKDAAKKLLEQKRGIIVAPTGTGKSLLMAKMIWDLGLKTLVITPSKEITNNMIDTLVKFFGKGKISKLNTKSGKVNKINVCNIQALIKLKPSILQEIDAVFIDEFHHSAAETYMMVNAEHLKHCYYRIGLTATNFRNDGSDLGLEAVLSEIIYEYPITQAIKDGFLVKPTFEIVENESPAFDKYQTEYKKSIVENENRNRIITEIVSYHHNDQVLVLVQQIEHGETLKSLLPQASFINGQEKDSDRQRMLEDFRKGKIKCLIGTSVIGEGVDLPNANVLVMAGGGKARSQIMQNIGRVLRPGKAEATIYDFTDVGSNFLSEHALLRQEIYRIYD